LPAGFPMMAAGLPSRPSRWQAGGMRKVFPIILILAGVLMFGVGIAFTVNSVGSTVGSITSTTMIGSPFTTPGSATSDLQPGTYTVYENIGFTGSQPGNLTVDPDSITVTGPDGTDVTTTCISCGASSSTLTLGATTYIGIVSFNAGQAGSYTIASDDDTGANLVLGPSLAEAIGGIVNDLGGMFGWVGLAVLGGIVGFIGLIWLIVAAVTGRSKPQPVPGIPYYGATGLAAPGAQAPTAQGSWYPDPEDPSKLRWWDGRQWTDQRRPR